MIFMGCAVAFIVLILADSIGKTSTGMFWGGVIVIGVVMFLLLTGHGIALK